MVTQIFLISHTTLSYNLILANEVTLDAVIPVWDNC